MSEELKVINLELNDEIDRLRDQLGEQTRETSKWKNKYREVLEENELLARENKALEDDNYQKCSLNEELANKNKRLKKENEILLERVKRLES